jgi:hypothetical protein
LIPRRHPRLEENFPREAPTYLRNIQTGKSKKVFLTVGEARLGEKYQPQPPTYLRNIEKGKKEKKSWYQYVFLGLAWENEATEEVRSIGASSPKPSDQST